MFKSYIAHTNKPFNAKLITYESASDFDKYRTYCPTEPTTIFLYLRLDSRRSVQQKSYANKENKSLDLYIKFFDNASMKVQRKDKLN